MKSQFLVAALFLAGISPAAICASPASRAASQKIPMKDLGAQVEEKARLAVIQLNGQAKGKLDYSEQSLSSVESLLAEASRYASQLDAATHKALVELLGSYILEVAYKAHGGKFYWNDQRGQPLLVVGEPSYHIGIMTFDKVSGRLEGDGADNIPFFYQGFAERLKRATPGTSALYV